MYRLAPILLLAAICLFLLRGTQIVVRALGNEDVLLKPLLLIIFVIWLFRYALRQVLPGSDAVIGGLVRGSVAVVAGTARMTVLAFRQYPSSRVVASGGSVVVETLIFRVVEADNTVHDCLAEGTITPAILARGDDVEVTGRTGRNGVFRIRRIRVGKTRAVITARTPLAMFTEYGARAAWVLLTVFLITLSVS